MSDDADKKHDPSEKGWRDSAEKGQLPRSMDLVSVAILVTGILTCIHGASWAVDAIERRMLVGLAAPYSGELTLETGLQLFLGALEDVARALMVPLGAIALVAIVFNVAQTRGQIASKALEPDPNRVNPLKGFQNHYMSIGPWVELGKGLFKFGLLAGVAYLLFADHLKVLPTLANRHPRTFLSFIAADTQRLIVSVIAPFLLLAVADYAYSYYKLFQQLKRTDQQVKDEHKEQEGDPQMKGKRRAMARKFATSTVLAAVSEADVIVTNPTHYAVAIRYTRGKDQTPVVVCKGVDHLAFLIRKKALNEGIPRIEDRPLARALYAQVEPGEPIPEALFVPVARVLAIVFRRRRASAGR